MMRNLTFRENFGESCVLILNLEIFEGEDLSCLKHNKQGNLNISNGFSCFIFKEVFDLKLRNIIIFDCFSDLTTVGLILINDRSNLEAQVNSFANLARSKN